MVYRQKVIIKRISIDKVIDAFHDINFVKFLISFQPVKIVHWSGITNGLIAELKFWFIKWNSIKVEHQKYEKTNKKLYFVDRGIGLPLGLNHWKHEHIVEKMGENIIIKDRLDFSHDSIFIGYILYPILVIPIFLRKTLYPIYFYINKSRQK